MNLQALPHFVQILEDSESLLQSSAASLIFQKANERKAESYNLSFRLPVPEKAVEKVVRSRLCTSCARRISYKPRQFESEKIRQPFLVLIHNNFIDVLQEGNKRKYYQDPLANDWFFKIFQGVFAASPEDFLVREILRCLFSREDMHNREWLNNCFLHIQEDILKYSLRGILILGEAAPLLFSKEEAREKMASVFELVGKPTVISSGPSRLAFLQKKRVEPEEIRREKMRIFTALSVFKKEVMKIN